MIPSVNLKVPPAEEPVSLDEVKTHLKLDLDSTVEDTYINGLIRSSREYAEGFIKRALMPQTWELSFDCFLGIELIKFPFSPLISVENFDYIDTDGNPQTLDPSKYIVNVKSTPGQLKPAYGEVWPSVRNGIFNAVVVEFKAGYADASTVPADIRHGMLMHIGHLYERRESSIIGNPALMVPMATESLLLPYVIWS